MDNRQVITGERVYLRPIEEADTDLVLSWRNAPSVVNNFIYREPITKEEHLEWIRTKVEPGLVHQFVVVLKETEEPLGVVYLQHIEDGQAESGIFFSTSASGAGYGAESYKLLGEYAFQVLGLHRLTARILSYNEGSIALHEKCGYEQRKDGAEEIVIDGRKETVLWYEKH